MPRARAQFASNATKKKLSPKRSLRLDQIGLEASLNGPGSLTEPGAMWMKRYHELVQFKARLGHCHVPRRWKENRALGRWVYAQRRNKRLNASRAAKLSNIGFNWNCRDALWEENYQVLKEFHTANGHCNVGVRQKLYQWLWKQRKDFRAGTLNDNRVARLNALDGNWQIGVRAPKQATAPTPVSPHVNRNRLLLRESVVTADDDTSSDDDYDSGRGLFWNTKRPFCETALFLVTQRKQVETTAQLITPEQSIQTKSSHSVDETLTLSTASVSTLQHELRICTGVYQAIGNVLDEVNGKAAAEVEGQAAVLDQAAQEVDVFDDDVEPGGSALVSQEQYDESDSALMEGSGGSKLQHQHRSKTGDYPYYDPEDSSDDSEQEGDDDNDDPPADDGSTVRTDDLKLPCTLPTKYDDDSTWAPSLGTAPTKVST